MNQAMQQAETPAPAVPRTRVDGQEHRRELLARYEGEVEKAFQEARDALDGIKGDLRKAGEGLRTINSKKLYRLTHKTWDAYLKARWGFTRQRAHQLMKGAEVIRNLSTVVDNADKLTERKVRRLTRETPQEQRELALTGALDKVKRPRPAKASMSTTPEAQEEEDDRGEAAVAQILRVLRNAFPAGPQRDTVTNIVAALVDPTTFEARLVQAVEDYRAAVRAA
ncbi:MAG: hypothetical protein ACRD3C_23895 [Vicinamibacterales bacterium]